jgi:hypothetical protein
MTTVLRFLRHTDIVAQIPVLDDYRMRCEARPAFPPGARRPDGCVRATRRLSGPTYSWPCSAWRMWLFQLKRCRGILLPRHKAD